MEFVLGFFAAMAFVAIVVEIGLRSIKDRDEREERRNRWEREILQVGREGSGLR